MSAVLWIATSPCCLHWVPPLPLASQTPPFYLSPPYSILPLLHSADYNNLPLLVDFPPRHCIWGCSSFSGGVPEFYGPRHFWSTICNACKGLAVAGTVEPSRTELLVQSAITHCHSITFLSPWNSRRHIYFEFPGSHLSRH